MVNSVLSSAPASGRPLLLLVSSLTRTSREPFLQAVSSKYDVWQLSGGAGRSSELTWEAPYVVGYTPVDTLDPAAMKVAADRIRRARPIDGVITYDETRTVAAAQLAEDLGLPGSSPEAVGRCRDKRQTRAALRSAGVRQPGSVSVTSLEEARSAARELGFPVVVKPCNQSCSFGVFRCDDDAQLTTAYAETSQLRWDETPFEGEDGVLIEEYIEGPEISVDCVLENGFLHAVTIARKQVGFSPAFEEMGHVVYADDPLIGDPCLQHTLEGIHKALGFESGATHVEFRLLDEEFVLIEINARLGGGLIPLLGKLAHGVDASIAAVDAVCGRELDLHPRRSRVAAISYYYPTRSSVIQSAEFDTSWLPDSVWRADILASPGQRILLPPEGAGWQSRLAQAIAIADNAQGCGDALDRARSALRAYDEHGAVLDICAPTSTLSLRSTA